MSQGGSWKRRREALWSSPTGGFVPTRKCCGLNRVLNSYAGVLTPTPQNVTVLEDNVLTEEITGRRYAI